MVLFGKCRICNEWRSRRNIVVTTNVLDNKQGYLDYF
jgi:hypothetical protein